MLEDNMQNVPIKWLILISGNFIVKYTKLYFYYLRSFIGKK